MYESVHSPISDKIACVNAKHREDVVCIELMPPLLRSPYAGGPLVERASCKVHGTVYHAESRSGAVCKLCRVLMADDVPDGPWLAFRAGKLVMSGWSIHALAQRGVL
ncbi:hypothetical protein [Acidocella aminolytica]|jgi:hypothetical protein|uniref:Uncharacterized protein n=1 Tax=Acidocella aminolytica 101 = DSM 11237 TaxID=1120923 RepID=A0A0D6PG51_9PROT|nr:hypothetical protein [Acidocella aminolytica]GAN80622.1 hypothetical protein Aam_055_002 [Acidocella aminolytica 101 = DSM 11237]GBQ40167.1 hypothetical protein AA11237_2279 [Acidocella aminolytica 101 = DSM 11237]SHE55946.1 hypothetical protein SAMN02746095_00784 [Acidocella aminolytica 101 = DSM 11237]